MSDVYTSKERAIVFCVLYIVSLIISFIYIFLRVNYNQISLIIFIISIIYASSFVFLHLLSMFDLCFNSDQYFEKFSNFISIYYVAFAYIDKILGFVLFNLLIYYLESGHYETHKKLLDGFIRFYNGIQKMSLCKKIAILAIGIPVIVILLVFLIKYRDYYELTKNPLEFLNIILDCYSIFQIYACVGFFIIQIISDFRTKRKEYLMKRYYRYSIIKIIEATEKNLDKMKKQYEALNKAFQKMEKNDSSPYYLYVKETLQKEQYLLQYFGLVYNNLEINNNGNILTLNNNAFETLSNMNNIQTSNDGFNQQVPYDKTEDKEIADKKVEIKENENEKEKEKEKEKEE